MAEVDERRFGDLIVRIDRHLCVGFGDCIDEAPEVFALDAEHIAVFRNGRGLHEREVLERACDACPVDALSLHVANGRVDGGS